jgi:hypothetical protein
MSMTFTDLMKDRRLSPQATTTVPETPAVDPIIRLYNNYWGAASNTRMTRVGDHYIISGSWLHDKKKAFTLFNKGEVSGVNVTRSGFPNAYAMFYFYRVDFREEKVNGEVCLVSYPVTVDQVETGILQRFVPDLPRPEEAYFEVFGTMEEVAKELQEKLGGVWSCGDIIHGQVGEIVYKFLPGRKTDIVIPSMPDITIYEVKLTFHEKILKATSTNAIINARLREVDLGLDNNLEEEIKRYI